MLEIRGNKYLLVAGGSDLLFHSCQGVSDMCVEPVKNPNPAIRLTQPTSCIGSYRQLEACRFKDLFFDTIETSTDFLRD